MLVAWCLLAAWCLNTCQTHLLRPPPDGSGRCSSRSSKQASGIKHQAASIKQRTLRNWALRPWQEIDKSCQFLMRFSSLMSGCSLIPKDIWGINKVAKLHVKHVRRLINFLENIIMWWQTWPCLNWRDLGDPSDLRERCNFCESSPGVNSTKWVSSRVGHIVHGGVPSKS